MESVPPVITITNNNVDLAVFLPKLWLIYQPLMITVRRSHFICWSEQLPWIVQYCAMTLTFVDWKSLEFSVPLIKQFDTLADIGDLLLLLQSAQTTTQKKGQTSSNNANTARG